MNDIETRVHESSPGVPRADHLRHLGERVLHEPAVLLSVAYLATSALGLWASYWLYHPFGIPIFEYMQPGDLLIAGLRDPLYLVMVALGLSITWWERWYERYRFENPERLARLRESWWRRIFVVPRWRERLAAGSRTPWRRFLRVALVPYIALVLIYVYTQVQADHLRAGEGTRITLTWAGDAAPTAAQPLLIGTTAAWVFVYWPDQHRVEAIAQQSLRSLTYPAVKPLRRATESPVPDS